MSITIEDGGYLFWMIPLAYLLGSLPSAVWAGKVFHGIDVREHGSGNAGATNVMRVLGVKTGIPVLLIDMLKGFFAVNLLDFYKQPPADDEAVILISLLLGVTAVLGHIFPVLAGFRGGKGVATIAGVCFAMHFPATALALVVFILVLVITKYVSLGSISAGFSYPLLVMLVFQSDSLTLNAFSIAASILLVVTHRKNIIRLLNGKESKATFLFGAKKD